MELNEYVWIRITAEESGATIRPGTEVRMDVLRVDDGADGEPVLRAAGRLGETVTCWTVTDSAQAQGYVCVGSRPNARIWQDA